MAILNSTRKHGVASLESFRGKLRIRIPRSCFPGQQKALSLGLEDTPKNRQIAQLTLEKLQRDIDWGDFDPTLERYKPKVKQETYLKSVKDLYPDMLLKDLWKAYLEYLAPNRKLTTIEYLKRTIGTKIENCPEQSPFKPLEVKTWLLENYSESMVKRCLIQINAACKWGLKHKKIKGASSPFEGMAKEFKHNWELEKSPKAFSFEEKEKIIATFKNHKSNGRNYKHYAPFVEFLFLTGCRPHEAIGLEWRDIDLDFRFITFNGGVSCLRGKFVSSKGKGSKNNRVRKFPINERLRKLLEEIGRKEGLVFPSKSGGYINYLNFSKRAWDSVVDPIKPGTTPYSCRDTFMTEQISKGIGAGIIAKWCDSSIEMIEKNYLDSDNIGYILPQ